MVYTGITTLYERRERLCHQFFQQNKNNAKITELFPDPYTSNYDLRLRRKYNNYVCKTDRFKHSFLPQMILKENNKIVIIGYVSYNMLSYYLVYL